MRRAEFGSDDILEIGANLIDAKMFPLAPLFTPFSLQQVIPTPQGTLHRVPFICPTLTAPRLQVNCISSLNNFLLPLGDHPFLLAKNPPFSNFRNPDL